jgi:hypothetical protein
MSRLHHWIAPGQVVRVAFEAARRLGLLGPKTARRLPSTDRPVECTNEGERRTLREATSSLSELAGTHGRRAAKRAVTRAAEQRRKARRRWS